MSRISSNTLITGASSGIGWELAKIAAREGCNLFLVARRIDILQKLKSELESQYGVKVFAFRADLSDPSSAKQVVVAAERELGQIDVLMNNAGFGSYGPFAETDWETEHQILELNIVTLTELTRRLLPGMIARGSGKILNVSSCAAFQPGPLMAVYFATKAYVQSFSEAIANELKGTGVTVTALCPGATESGFQEAAGLGQLKHASGRNLPSSLEVAEFGYQAMMKGKTFAIHGTMNRILATAVRFLPRNTVTVLVRRLQESIKTALSNAQ